MSPACKNCYAESLSKRTGHKVWGADAPRRFFGTKHWVEPLKWNRKAEKAGERRRVFCGSMMDVCELHDDGVMRVEQDLARSKLGLLIEQTPHLDWLLLTKRPENFAECFPEWANGCPPNVWVGTTVENQEYADFRIPHLLKIKARVLFLSCEPLLGPIALGAALGACNCIVESLEGAGMHASSCPATRPAVSWVISGGESGACHREHHLEHSRSLRDQCAAAGVAFFFKQLGERATIEIDDDDLHAFRLSRGLHTRLHVPLDKAPRSKGEKLEEIPPDLRIREFPCSA